jgi:hypothetical protein
LESDCALDSIRPRRALDLSPRWCYRRRENGRTQVCGSAYLAARTSFRVWGISTFSTLGYFGTTNSAYCRRGKIATKKRDRGSW